MKLFLTLALTIISLTVYADNPIDQYCGVEQYGYLHNGKLYTAPLGLGWQFPQPNGSYWVKTQNGYLGANVYKLQCDVDTWVIVLLFIVGLYSYFKIKTNYGTNNTTIC